MWGTATADQFRHPLPPNVLWFLDTDSTLCAQALSDVHLVEVFMACCRTLAEVQVKLHPDTVASEWSVQRAEPIPGNLPHLHTTVGGLQVAYAPNPTPYGGWCGELGGNYLWVYALAQSIALEHAARTGGQIPGLLALYACEALPSALRTTYDEWCLPAPVVAPDCIIMDGEYFDTVASCRKDYCKHRLPGQAWTMEREFPSWMEE